MTDPIKRHIIAMNSLDKTNDASSNKLRTIAKNMQYPKSIVFDNDGLLYFIDSNQIKSINSDGDVAILIKNKISTNYRPQLDKCISSFTLDTITFYWPIALAINPIDNSLYVLDEGVIFKITSYGAIEVIAGLYFGCEKVNSKFKKLHNPVDMAFNSEGVLFVLENDPIEKIKQISLIKSNGEMEIFLGENGQLMNGFSFDFGFSQTSNVFKFNDPIAIAIHQNRSIYVLDKGKLKLESNFSVKATDFSLFDYIII